jgi:hypothetical protein
MHRPVTKIAVLAAALALALAACSEEGDEGGTAEAAVARKATRDTLREPYREEAGIAGGRIGGVVELASEEAPPDSVATPPAAAATACGGSMRVPLVAHQGTRLGEVVVWLDDIRAGKPLPIARRYELSNERCLLEPRVQAALAGGMLNVKSADPLQHRTRLTRDGDSIAVVEHTDAGSVVPVGRVLARPGVVAARSELHLWMRAWIQVFDHPYFAVTRADGQWALDSVPPGRWRLAAWHPRYGRRDTTVTVEAGQALEVRLAF